MERASGDAASDAGSAHGDVLRDSRAAPKRKRRRRGKRTERVGTRGRDVRPLERLLGDPEAVLAVEVLEDVVDRLSRRPEEAAGVSK